MDVKISSNTDKWALNILNLLVAMRGFFSGIAKAREVPIFGDLGTGDMLFGIIDELHFDEKTYSLHLLELKTRKSTRLPGVAQAKQNALQVSSKNELTFLNSRNVYQLMCQVELVAYVQMHLKQLVVQWLKCLSP